MELKDLLVTPLVIAGVYFLAYLIRPWITDEVNRVYFFPAFTVKIVGALLLGIIYQFYYNGGDTYNYHTHGSRVIWEAFNDSFSKGLDLLTADGVAPQGTYQYTSRIPFFTDPSSYAMIRIAAILDLFTFSTYSATAVLIATLSFFGMWLFFLAFYREFPQLHRWIAVAAFFIPSVFFWGSGLMKDTVTLASLGAATYAIRRIFIDREVTVMKVSLLLFSLFVIFSLKKYVLLCFLPAALLWVFTRSIASVESVMLRTLLVPVVIVITIFSGYFAVLRIGADDKRYSLDKIANTARVTAYDIGFYTGRDAGSGYSLGELDGTFGGMVKLAPQAINVSLFRPYVWEVRNPFMLLSALESLALFLLLLYTLVKKRLTFFRALRNPNVLFCLVFSVTFAFAVGVSTFNFGTLVRYKIPLLPFFLLALTLILNYENSETNEEELEATE